MFMDDQFDTMMRAKHSVLHSADVLLLFICLIKFIYVAITTTTIKQGDSNCEVIMFFWY